MKYHVKFTNAFKKAYKRSRKRGLKLDKLDEVIDELRQGHVLPAKYHDHALTGGFAGFRECHIQSDWLLVYMIEENVLTLTLADLGSHADIFDM